MVDINLIPREYRERKLGVKAIISKTTIIALAVLVLSLLFYGGLLFYKKNLINNLEVINQEILELEQKRNPETEKAMVDLDKRISVLKKLFENHLYWSNLFAKIEKLIIPEAYFTGAAIKLSGDALTLSSSGGTTSYTNLARQISSFQEEPLISSVKVSAIGLDEKMGIRFGIAVNFFKKILLENSDNND